MSTIKLIYTVFSLYYRDTFDFYNSKGEKELVKVEMMTNMATVEYGVSKEGQVLGLPYKGKLMKIFPRAVLLLRDRVLGSFFIAGLTFLPWLAVVLTTNII